MAPSEQLTFDPAIDGGTGATLELNSATSTHGINLLEHSYPIPEIESTYAGSADTEGDPLVSNRYKNRSIKLKVRVYEPGEGAATNNCVNPSGEVDTAHWAATASTGAAAIARVASGATSGDYTIAVSGTAGTVQLAEPSADYTACVPGDVIRASADLFPTAIGGGTVSFLVEFFTSGKSSITQVTLGTTTANATLKTITGSATAPATTAYYRVVALLYGGSGAVALLADNIAHTKNEVLGPAFNGDTPGCKWTGARHASTSTRPATGGPRFAAIRRDLQMKVERLNEYGGTLRRIDANGDPIIFDVLAADIDFTDDKQTIRLRKTEATIDLTCKPFGRGYPITATDRVETTKPVLTFTETIKGDVPALGSLTVDEDQNADQMWLTWGLQTENYSAAATADLFYECVNLTPLGTTGYGTGAGITGAYGSGTNKTISGALTGAYSGLVSSQASGGGAHWTHNGAFRVRARVGVQAGGSDVKLRLDWSNGDFRSYESNSPVTIPSSAAGTWRDIDLGVVYPTNEAGYWQARLQGYTTGAATVEVNYLYLVPVDEGSGEVYASTQVPPVATYSARDEFKQTSGAATGKTLPVGGTWGGSGSSNDFSIGTYLVYSAILARAFTSDTAGTQNGRFLTASTPTSLTATAVGMSILNTGAMFSGLRSGVLARFTNTSNYLVGYLENGTLKIEQRIAGTTTVLASQTLSYLPITGGSLKMTVTAGGVATLTFSGFPSLTVYSSALATGGALASGTVGIYDQNTTILSYIRVYDNFYAYPYLTDAALFAGRSLKITDSYARHQDVSGTQYQPVGAYYGKYLTIPQSGNEKRTTRFLVKASRGFPLLTADTSTDDISARLTYTPRYLVVGHAD